MVTMPFWQVRIRICAKVIVTVATTWNRDTNTHQTGKKDNIPNENFQHKFNAFDVCAIICVSFLGVFFSYHLQNWPMADIASLEL